MKQNICVLRCFEIVDLHVLKVFGLGFLFNVPVNNFQSFWDGATASWVFTSTLGTLKCLAQ